ncbi:MAG: hypothetical protein GWN58_44615 [Anaerolineae bacterium]|nr:hypothetical protein [Anaerolineae bacterium]
MGKKKTAAAIEWATALVEELPQLVETATAENKRWHQEQVALVRSVSGFGIEVSNYDGHLKKASIHIRQFLTPEQVQAIAEIVGRNDE